MKVSVRLYRQHDMDLIRVYLGCRGKFTVYLREALRAFCRRYSYSIPAQDVATDYTGYLPTIINMHVTLDNSEDADIIRLLDNIKNKQRNAFIKAVARKSLATIPLSIYFKGDGIVMSRASALLEDLEDAGPIQKPKPRPQQTRTAPNRPVVSSKPPVKLQNTSVLASQTKQNEQKPMMSAASLMQAANNIMDNNERLFNDEPDYIEPIQEPDRHDTELAPATISNDIIDLLSRLSH